MWLAKLCNESLLLFFAGENSHHGQPNWLAIFMVMCIENDSSIRVKSIFIVMEVHRRRHSWNYKAAFHLF